MENALPHPVNPSHADKMRALPWYYTFQSSNMVFVLLTIFGPVFPLFMHALGLSKTQIGLLLAIPHVFTLLALLVAGLVVRRGPKNIFMGMTLARAIIISGLLLIPFLRPWLTPAQIFLAMAAIIAGFAFCRAVAETGYLPWEKQFIPDRSRGKVYAVNGIIAGVTAMCTSLAASLVLRRMPGIAGYQWLILAGIAFSMVSIWCLRYIPGGGPAPAAARPRPLLEDLLTPLRDSNFRRFLLANGLFVLACGVFPFLPLYLQSQFGLPPDRIMTMDMALRGGVLIASLFWGWSADRFGGRPVAITGILMVMVFPLALCIMPANFRLLALALGGIYCFYGMAIQGYLVGMTRYLYADAVPAQGGAGYYAIHYSIAGVSTAVGPFLAGYLLDFNAPLNLQWRWLAVTPYTPVLLLSAALFAAAAAIGRGLRSAAALPTGKFLSLLIQGNPLLAFGSIVRYQFAWNEDERVSTTERMGRAKNTASADELLSALQDPSFNVRYEAILAIARLPASPPLSDALVGVLRSQEPDLSVAAGWALGRLGDRRAIPALRETLHSEYALLRSRAARSLANLGDRASASAIMDAMRRERHDAIRVAYATALGSLRIADALPGIMDLLGRLPAVALRNETALAAARIAGCDRQFIRLWRAARHEPGAAFAAVLRQAEPLFANRRDWPPPARNAWEAGIQALQTCDLEGGARQMAWLLERLASQPAATVERSIWETCRRQFSPDRGGDLRLEYLLLALSLLQKTAQSSD